MRWHSLSLVLTLIDDAGGGTRQRRIPDPGLPSGTWEVTLVLGPVMDFVPDRGMRIAVSFDNEAPQVLDIFSDCDAETFLGRTWWNQFTRDNVRNLRSSHAVRSPGPHTLRVNMVDSAIVVEKVILTDRPCPEAISDRRTRPSSLFLDGTAKSNSLSMLPRRTLAEPYRHVP
jgi:hypothetical protein